MKWGKATLVIFGALVVTALGIDAADTLRGNDGTLLSQIIQTEQKTCPPGMAPVGNVPTINCVDIYEVSTSETCPVESPGSVIHSNENIQSSSCEPESKDTATPWRFITRDQAMQMCARVGKRLPSSREWYELSLGLPDPDASCNTNSGNIRLTGVNDACVAPSGAYDLIGNVWEWVSDDVVNGMYESKMLPESGYVAQVDAGGMPMVSTSTEQGIFGNDYFWSKQEGTFGIIRGGYYSSGDDAGVYTVHADTLPTTAGTAIGFRCVK